MTPETRPLPSRFLAGFGLAALAVWAVIGLLVHQANRQAVDGATAAARNLARSLAEYESSSIQAIDLSLRFLRDDWLRDPRSFGEKVARHEVHLEREKVIQVAVVDQDGWVRYSKLPQPESVNFADREYFQLQKARGRDELHISEPVFGRVTQRWALQFSRPIFGRDGRFAGLIVVAVPPPALEQVYEDIELGAHGTITLARADGTILARTGDLRKGAAVSLAGVPGLAEDEPLAGDVRLAGRIDGVDRFYSYRKLEGHPLTLYVGQSADTVLAPYFRQRNLLLLGGVLASALLAAVAMLLFVQGRDRAKFLEERERLMLDLHDGCIQSVYAIGLNLQNCRRLIGKDPAGTERAIAEAGANLNLVIQDLRAFIARETRAGYTEEEFMAELRRSIPGPGAGGPAFSVDVDPAVVGKLSGEQATHLLRIAREAVSNIVRHANATTARLRLEPRDGTVRLEVSDDGVGIAARPAGELGLGLHHIRARARKLGGHAHVVSVPNQGTRIAVEFSQR